MNGDFKLLFKVTVPGPTPSSLPMSEHYFYESGRVANYYINGCGGTSWNWDPVACLVTTERTLMNQLGPLLQDAYQKHLAKVMLDG